MSFDFLVEEYTTDNHRRMIQPRLNSICNTVFAMYTHAGTLFGKYFALSTLVSQPPIVAGSSTLFPLFVNDYDADGMFQNDSHL